MMPIHAPVSQPWSPDIVFPSFRKGSSIKPTHLFDARRCARYQPPPVGHTPPTDPSRLSHDLKRSPKPSSPMGTFAISWSSVPFSIRHSILLVAQPPAEPIAPDTTWKIAGSWHKKPRILIGSTACWPRHRLACCWICARAARERNYLSRRGLILGKEE
jgi:hypothetical protein